MQDALFLMCVFLHTLFLQTLYGSNIAWLFRLGKVLRDGHLKFLTQDVWGWNQWNIIIPQEKKTRR